MAAAVVALCAPQVLSLAATSWPASVNAGSAGQGKGASAVARQLLVRGGRQHRDELDHFQLQRHDRQCRDRRVLHLTHVPRVVVTTVGRCGRWALSVRETPRGSSLGTSGL